MRFFLKTVVLEPLWGITVGQLNGPRKHVPTYPARTRNGRDFSYTRATVGRLIGP